MTIYIKNKFGVVKDLAGKTFQVDEYRDVTNVAARFANNDEVLEALANDDAAVAKTDDGTSDITKLSQAINYLHELPETDDLGRPINSTQSVQLFLAKAESGTNVDGVAAAIIKIPALGRTIEGGWGKFQNQSTGDWLTIDLKDDDDLYGFGAGATISTFDDQLVPTGNQGYFFLGDESLAIHPLIPSDPTELPGGLYLYICGHKKNTGTVEAPIYAADHLYVNIHWGKRIR